MCVVCKVRNKGHGVFCGLVALVVEFNYGRENM